MNRMRGKGRNTGPHLFVAYNASNKVWNGSSYEDWNDSNIGSYGITATQEGTSSWFTGNEPPGTVYYVLVVAPLTLPLQVTWEDNIDYNLNPGNGSFQLAILTNVDNAVIQCNGVAGNIPPQVAATGNINVWLVPGAVTVIVKASGYYDATIATSVTNSGVWYNTNNTNLVITLTKTTVHQTVRTAQSSPTPPKYNIGYQVYLAESAKIGGVIESYKVSSIRMLPNGQWRYRISITQKPPTSITVLSDRNTGKHSYDFELAESELCTFCEAITFAETYLSGQLDKIRRIKAAYCS